MTGFPNMPPPQSQPDGSKSSVKSRPSRGGKASKQSSRKAGGKSSGSASPSSTAVQDLQAPRAPAAVAAAPPPNPTPPAIAPDTGKLVEMTEDEYQKELFKETHSVPLFMTGVGGMACLAVAAGRGYILAGPGGAMGMSLVGVLLFAFALLTGTMAAFVVGKMFDSDFGSAGGLIVRVGALTVAHFLIFMGLGAFLELPLVLFLSLPITLGLATWILGMSALQALLFSLMMGAIAIISLTVVLVSLVSMIGPAPAGV